MVAQEGTSSSSRGTRSSSSSKETVQRDKEIKEKKIENGDISRKKGMEKKVLSAKDKKIKNPDIAQASIHVGEPSKNHRSKSADRGRKKGTESKDRSDAASNVNREANKKKKENLEKAKSDRESVHIKSKRKNHQGMLTHSKGNDIGKSNDSKKPGDDASEFSRIESMIFEDHPGKGVPVKKQTEREKGKAKKAVDISKNTGKSEKKSKVFIKGTDNNNIGKTLNKARKEKNVVQKGKSKGKRDLSESDSSDWEEVDGAYEEINELEALLNDSEDTKIATNKSVKIELDAPDVVWGMKKRKKRRTEEEMIEEYLRRHVNRSIKEVYENMHKTHLLCLFGHYQYINKALNSEILLSAALSIITDKNAYPPKRLDMNYLEKFVRWFSRKITLKIQDLKDDYWSLPLETLIVKRFENKTARSNREFVLMFVMICRAVGMNVRLIISLQPMSWKPSTDTLLKKIKKEKESLDFGFNEPSCSKARESHNVETQIKEEKPKVKYNRKMLSFDSDVELKGKKHLKKKNSGSSSKDDLVCSQPLKKKSKRSSSLSDGSDMDFDPSLKIKKGPKVRSVSKNRSSSEGCNEGGKKRKLNGKDDGKDENKEGKRKKTEPLIEWAEIYVEEEEKWMCVDITKSKIHCIPEIEARTPSSSAYITAFNADLTVKDVTRRYMASWLSNENKLRCCSRWWGKAIRGFRGKRSRLDKEEDEEMDQNLRQQPMPKVIGEYKNHPLYALQRHLLKFEAIYPPDEGPVGYLKGEPVYPRSSVYTLCSRDSWTKEAKTVRVGEEPYKILKARPKWDRNLCQMIKDRPLEVFGEWQVEDYEPPVASGGKVPRNDYGNVELFKPSMLPRGCVHLPMNGLNRIARKLDIDCAAAMTGFDYHSGWSHPVYDGFVVCEEFKDILLDAWNQDQVEQAKRAEEKREKRIYSNWKKLIHGMMVKDHVREVYGNHGSEDDREDQGDEETSNECKDEGKGKKNEQKKPKITQEETDSVRPPLITHSVRNLKIDLTSNVVEMAKASRNSTMKSNNSVKPKVRRSRAKKNSQPSTNKDDNIDDSSDETDEEVKKEKIRAILQWGTRAASTNPNLSDDSDNEENSLPSCSKSAASQSMWQNDLSLKLAYKLKNTRRKKEHSTTEQGSEDNSNISSCSTTSLRNVDNVPDLAPRKGLRRSAKQNLVKYEESDEGDISLDESDVEDKSYNPLKGKVVDTLNLSESD